MSDFFISKIGTKSVNLTDFEDIEIFTQFRGNSFLKFWSLFEIAWVFRSRYHPMCIFYNVGHFDKYNKGNFQFLVVFSLKTIFAPSPTTTTFISKYVEFLCPSFDTCQKFVAFCPFTQTPTQMSKYDFWGSVPRKWVWVCYHWRWFLKLYNLGYLDSNFVHWVRKSKKSRNST